MKPFFIFIWTLVWLSSGFVSAQLDPSSSVLLDGASGAEPTSSGRYTKKPEAEIIEIRDVETEVPEVTVEVKPLPEEVKSLPEEVKSLPEEVRDNKEKTELVSVELKHAHKKETKTHGKKGFFDLEIAPAFLYLDSSSNYSFREYNFFSHGLVVSTRLALDKEFSLWGKYTTSLEADISSQGKNRVGVDDKRVKVGLDIKKTYWTGKKTTSLFYGIFFLENNFKVSSEEENRVNLRTSGFGLRLKIKIPVTEKKSWDLGVALAPKLLHREKDTNRFSLSSGTDAQASELSISLGCDYELSKGESFFWNLEVSSEKNIFSGPVSEPEPKTGQIPTNTSVKQVMSTLSFGYRWGS